MTCLRGSVSCFTTMVVLHDSRASYICILLVISFLIKLTCIVLRNRLSNVARESRNAKRSLTFFTSGWTRRFYVNKQFWEKATISFVALDLRLKEGTDPPVRTLNAACLGRAGT